MNGALRVKPHGCEVKPGQQQPVQDTSLSFPLVSRFAALFLLTLCLSGAEIKPGELLFQEGASYRAEGRQLQDAGDLQRALAVYRMAVAVYPTYAEVYNDMGVVFETLGKSAEAEEFYKRALRFKPELAGAHSNLALLYEKQGKVKEAAGHWAARIRTHGGSSNDPWILKAKEKLTQYKFPIPEPLIEEVRRVLWAGRAHLEAKRWNEAVTELERIRALDPENREVSQLLKKAQTEAARAERSRQKEIEAARSRALKKGKPVELSHAPVVVSPLKEVSPAPAPEPWIPATAFRLADEYAREKGKTRRKTTQELYDRGLVALRAGRYDEAEESFRQILTLDPDNLNAVQALVRTEKAKEKANREAARKGR